MKNWTATSFCASCSASCDITRDPVKRQMMITLATPSTAESSPKPTSAIEPAATPAAIATTPSTLMAAERQPRQQLHAPREELVLVARDGRDRRGHRKAGHFTNDARANSTENARHQTTTVA